MFEYRKLLEALAQRNGYHPWDAEDAADFDPVMGERIKEFGFFLSTHRPNFGTDQVRDVAEIVPGSTFVYCNLPEESREPITILSDPYENERGELVAKMRGTIGGRERGILYLSQCSVVPNKVGEWNCWNLLERIKG